MNKEIRHTLIERYLSAETTPDQERRLAEWFSSHEADSDEESAAELILAEYPDAAYYAAEKEFDTILASAEKKSRQRTRFARWAYGCAACAVVAVGLGIFLTQRQTCDFNGLEMAQGIEKIMSLDMENVESITAKPKGNKVILTAILNDGTRCLYEMTRDEGSTAISITAMR